MTLSAGRRNELILMGVALLLLIVAIFAGGWHCARFCSPEPPPPPPSLTEIDAGPGDRLINARLEEAARRADVDLSAIDARHADAGAAFQDAQVRELARVLDAGPEQVAEWIRDWARARQDGGSPR